MIARNKDPFDIPRHTPLDARAIEISVTRCAASTESETAADTVQLPPDGDGRRPRQGAVQGGEGIDTAPRNRDDQLGTRIDRQELDQAGHGEITTWLMCIRGVREVLDQQDTTLAGKPRDLANGAVEAKITHRDQRFTALHSFL